MADWNCSSIVSPSTSSVSLKKSVGEEKPLKYEAATSLLRMAMEDQCFRRADLQQANHVSIDEVVFRVGLRQAHIDRILLQALDAKVDPGANVCHYHGRPFFHPLFQPLDRGLEP